MKLELKEDFIVAEEGTRYALPNYRIVEGKGLEKIKEDDPNFYTDQYIEFVRGSKDKEDGVDEKVGTLHEHLLAMMIHDLKYKNQLVPSREGELIIEKLQEALGWLRQRQVDRTKRKVVGTYNE